jgi:hypothetical protein
MRGDIPDAGTGRADPKTRNETIHRRLFTIGNHLNPISTFHVAHETRDAASVCFSYHE